MSEPITILLAGQHALLLNGLRRLLDDEDDMRVVATVDGTDSALSAAATESVDVVIMSGDVDHLAAAVSVGLRTAGYQAKTVFVDTSDTSHRVLDLLRSGISAYLPIHASHEELKAAIRSIVMNSDRISLSLSREEFRRIDSSDKAQLSRLETEILGMVAGALTNGQIAHRLSLSEAVVKRHLRNIFRRLGAVSRLDAVNKASDAGILAHRRARAETGPEPGPPGGRRTRPTTNRTPRTPCRTSSALGTLLLTEA
jgi:DNA-binding NarL/FixJ family response regulator